jgi:hypothetical protein
LPYRGKREFYSEQKISKTDQFLRPSITADMPVILQEGEFYYAAAAIVGSYRNYRHPDRPFIAGSSKRSIVLFF